MPEDVRSALREAGHHFDLSERRTSLTDSSQLIRTLQEVTTDLVAVVRGGGEGLGVLDDPALGEAAIALSPLLVTAVGHAPDRPLLERLADKAFPTPTALGSYLRELVDEVAEEREHSKAKLTQAIRESFGERLNALEADLIRQRRLTWIVGALLLLLGGLVGWLL